MPNRLQSFISLAFSRDIILDALKVSVIVGTVLAIINHFDFLLRMELDADRALKIVLTYFVPYCVATYSSVKAIQDHEQKRSVDSL